MALGGVFGEDDRVELLEGEIVEMAPIGSRHAGCVNRLTRVFTERLQGRAVVAVQNPVRLGAHTEPQPDVALLRPRSDDYAGGHPTADDVLLLVEVAETSTTWDRDRKLPLYAAAGVGEVWLVDIGAATAGICRRPDGGEYRDMQTVGVGETVAPLAFPDVVMDVDVLLPPPPAPGDSR